MNTTTVELTARELTLIRVALLQRLDRLRDNPRMQESYNESRALMQGKLWAAVKAIGPDAVIDAAK